MAFLGKFSAFVSGVGNQRLTEDVKKITQYINVFFVFCRKVKISCSENLCCKKSYVKKNGQISMISGFFCFIYKTLDARANIYIKFSAVIFHETYKSDLQNLKKVFYCGCNQNNKHKETKMPTERNIKEKSYVDEQDFHLFVDETLPDKDYYQAYDAIELAFESLLSARVIVSKTQMTAALTAMKKVNVPICEAAAICQVTREYFRTLEKRGKIQIIRGKGKKCFIKPNDIIKYLTGKL